MSEVLGIKEGQLVSLIGENQIGPTKKIDQNAALRELAMKYVHGTKPATH